MQKEEVPLELHEKITPKLRVDKIVVTFNAKDGIFYHGLTRIYIFASEKPEETEQAREISKILDDAYVNHPGIMNDSRLIETIEGSYARVLNRAYKKRCKMIRMPLITGTNYPIPFSIGTAAHTLDTYLAAQHPNHFTEITLFVPPDQHKAAIEEFRKRLPDLPGFAKPSSL